jgi:hypothetical protein
MNNNKLELVEIPEEIAGDCCAPGILVHPCARSPLHTNFFAALCHPPF